MRHVCHLLLPLALVALAGCAENTDPKTPEGALHLLREALLAKDPARILELSSKATHELLAELRGLLEKQAEAIDTKYLAEHRAPAHAIYPKGVLEAKDDLELFSALIHDELERKKPSPGLAYGLTVLGVPNVDGDRATVSTVSGESVEFVRSEDGRWRTTVFEAQLRQNLGQAHLNEDILEQNLNVFAEIERRTKEKAAKDAAANGTATGAPDAAVAPAQSP